MDRKQATKCDAIVSDLQASFDLLSEHVDLQQVDRDAPLRNNTVYKNSLAIWMMVLQRMTPKGTLESTVYADSLRIAVQDKLPNRPDRQYPREAYARRPKPHTSKKENRRQLAINQTKTLKVSAIGLAPSAQFSLGLE